MAERKGWPEGTTFWDVDGEPAIISPSTLMALKWIEDGWCPVTPDGVRAEGEKLDRAAWEARFAGVIK